MFFLIFHFVQRRRERRKAVEAMVAVQVNSNASAPRAREVQVTLGTKGRPEGDDDEAEYGVVLPVLLHGIEGTGGKDEAVMVRGWKDVPVPV